LKRLLNAERRFKYNEDLRVSYTKFLYEYLELGHIELVEKENSSSSHERGYFLPHHAVVSENSSTTSLRVVFDASRKTNTGLSLNDVMLKGPSIQEELVTIL